MSIKLRASPEAGHLRQLTTNRIHCSVIGIRLSETVNARLSAKELQNCKCLFERPPPHPAAANICPNAGHEKETARTCVRLILVLCLGLLEPSIALPPSSKNTDDSSPLFIYYLNFQCSTISFEQNRLKCFCYFHISCDITDFVSH